MTDNQLIVDYPAISTIIPRISDSRIRNYWLDDIAFFPSPFEFAIEGPVFGQPSYGWYRKFERKGKCK